jgi:hypothetical protein
MPPGENGVLLTEWVLGKIIPEAQSFGLLPPLEIVGSESFNFLYNQLHPYANEPLPEEFRPSLNLSPGGWPKFRGYRLCPPKNMRI